MLGANIIWAMAYDTEYAMVDRDDDIKIGVKSTALLFGSWDRFWVGLFLMITICMLFVIGIQRGFGVYFIGGMSLAMLTVIWQLYLIWNRQREACFKAFLNNSWFGAFVFAGILLSYL